jgi:hypothetical protein
MVEKELIEQKIGEAIGLLKAAQVSKIMETYLGEEPDTQEALEFLCLAESAEVTHYEVLTSVAKNKK